MNATSRAPIGGAFGFERESSAVALSHLKAEGESSVHKISPGLFRTLAEVKGQAQFLLYLADQIEDSLDQLGDELDPAQGMFLCKVLGMYSAQLESKHQGLGDRISETCQEVYVTVREFDASI